MTGEINQGSPDHPNQESGTYARDNAIDESTLAALADRDDLPEDFEELERLMGFDSNNKANVADDKDAADDSTATPDDKAKQDVASPDAAADGADKDHADPDADANAAAAKPDAGEPSGPDKKPEGEAAKADAGNEAAAKPDDERKPDGVATRDGKHVIPYTVLESERRKAAEAVERATTVEERNRALEEELRILRQQSSQVAGDAKGAQDKLHDAETQQQTLLEKYGIEAKDLPLNADGTLNIEKAREEFSDETVNLLAATTKIIAGLSKTVNELQEDRAQQAGRERQLRAQQIQDLIDDNPDLAELQAEGGRRWTYAQSIDNDLKADPEWKTAPMRVRFAEVAHLVKGGKPRTVEEAEAAMNAAPKSDPKPDPASQAGNAQERAAEKLKAADAAVPQTHSDLPAGEHAAQHGQEQLESMDVMALEKAFENSNDPDALINKLLS